MPATFRINSQELSISRFTRVRPHVEIIGRGFMDGDQLVLRLHAPGHENELHQLASSLESTYRKVDLELGSANARITVQLGPADLKGAVGPAIRSIITRFGESPFRATNGDVQFWVPSADPAELQTVFIGRLGGNAAPVVEPFDLPDLPAVPTD